MNAVSSLRFPTAFIVALLITGALFSVLNAMTSVVVDVTPIPTREIVFERQRTDTPTPSRRTFEKPDRVIELPDQVDIPIRVDPTKVDNPIQLKADTGLPKDIGGGI